MRCFASSSEQAPAPLLSLCGAQRCQCRPSRDGICCSGGFESYQRKLMRILRP
jgi:hypothetical protein